jgi:hypothetical protein
MRTDTDCSEPTGPGPGDACPFVLPRSAGTGPVARASFYCRLPRGLVRVPAPDEQRLYCVTGRWDDCPTYLGVVRGVRARMGLL